MPIPSVLENLLGTKAFWSAYFGVEFGKIEPWEYDEDVIINMPVGNGYSLDLAFQLSYVYEVDLSLRSPSRPDPLSIASRGYCSFPQVFRWSELDLLSRAIAAYDPSVLMTKHLALLLLVRFTPLCVGDTPNVAIEAIHTFLSPLGFDYMEIRHILRTIDHRSNGFRWRFDEFVNGWVLDRYRTYTSGRNLYTYRSTDNKDFPFEIWPQFLSTAEETIHHSIGTSSLMAPENETGVVLPDYDLPTRHDVYLAVPAGKAPRLLLGHPETFLSRVLNRLLEDLDLGYSRYAGSTHFPEGHQHQLETTLYGELDRGLLVLRQVLWWQMAPEESLMSDLKYSNLSKVYPLKTITEELKSDKTELYVAFGALQEFDEQPTSQSVNAHPCKVLFQSLDEHKALPEHNGWRILKTEDGGEIHVCVCQASTSRKEDLVTVVVKNVTLEVANFLFRLLVVGELVLLPAMLTVVKNEKAPFKLITSENELLDILRSGPYQWWHNNGSTYTYSDS
ncbi:hypothetical protein GGI35DRAFT_440223 [Trichoderma velutinum]